MLETVIVFGLVQFAFLYFLAKIVERWIKKGGN